MQQQANSERKGGRLQASDLESFWMAFTETYRCDVCSKPKGSAEDWWLATSEQSAPLPGLPDQPTLKLTPWNILLSHTNDVKHLCGARCAQTLLDRWMRDTHMRGE
jgi:hypothetical protein